MTAKKVTAKSKPYREIPNRLVMDVAGQFHSAYLLLIRQPFSGVLMPALHCGFIGMELYLKALSATVVEVPDGLTPGGAYIHAQSPYPHQPPREALRRGTVRCPYSHGEGAYVIASFAEVCQRAGGTRGLQLDVHV